MVTLLLLFEAMFWSELVKGCAGSNCQRRGVLVTVYYYLEEGKEREKRRETPEKTAVAFKRGCAH